MILGVDNTVMAVNRRRLFRGEEDIFFGLSGSDGINFKNRILENYEYLDRSSVETDSNFVQPSVYSFITNPVEGSIFLYHRGRPVEFRDYSEKRGLAKRSIGVGGHVVDCESRGKDLIEQNLINKINHEVSSLGKYRYSLLGYLFSNEDEVSRFHIGLVYIVETELTEVLPKDEQMTDGAMMKRAEIKGMYIKEPDEFETWSKILLKYLFKL